MRVIAIIFWFKILFVGIISVVYLFILYIYALAQT